MLEHKVEYRDEYYEEDLGYTHFYAMMDDWLDAYKIEKVLGNKESFYLVQSNYDYYGETIDLYCPKGYGSYVFEDWTGGGREWFGQLPSDYTILDSKGRWHKEGYGFIWDDQAVIPFWNYGKIAEFNKTNKTHYIDLDGDFVYEEKPEALAYNDFLTLFNMISLVDYGQMSYDPAEEVLKFEDGLRIPAKTAYDHYKSEYSRHDSLASSNNVFRFIKELAQEHEKKTSNQSINDQNIEAKADDSISEEVSLETSPISTDSNSVTEKNNDPDMLDTDSLPPDLTEENNDLETKLLENVNNDGINTQQNVSENNSISVETANSSKESKKEILKEEIPEENIIQLENRPIQDLEIKQNHLVKSDDLTPDHTENIRVNPSNAEPDGAVGYSYSGELPINPPSYEESMGLAPFSEMPPSYEESIRTPLSESGRSIFPLMNNKGMFSAYLEPELRPDLPLEQQYERLVDWFEETNENHHAALESFRSLTPQQQARRITGLKRIIPENYEYDLPPAYDAVPKMSETPTPETGAIPKTFNSVVYDVVSESFETLPPEEQTEEIINGILGEEKNILKAELSPKHGGKIVRFQKGTLLDLDGIPRNPKQYYQVLLDENAISESQNEHLINMFEQANSVQKAEIIADIISAKTENQIYYYLLHSFNYIELDRRALYSEFFHGNFEIRASLLNKAQELLGKINHFEEMIKDVFPDQIQSSRMIHSFKNANSLTQKEIITKIETYRSDTVRDLYTKAGKTSEEIDSLIEEFNQFNITQQEEIITDLKHQVSELTGEAISDESAQSKLFQDILGRLKFRNTYDQLKYGALKNQEFFDRFDQVSKEDQNIMIKNMKLDLQRGQNYREMLQKLSLSDSEYRESLNFYYNSTSDQRIQIVQDLSEQIKQNETFETLMVKVNYSDEFRQTLTEEYRQSDFYSRRGIIERINQNIERVENVENQFPVFSDASGTESIESMIENLKLSPNISLDFMKYYQSIGIYEQDEFVFKLKQALENNISYQDQVQKMRSLNPNFETEAALNRYYEANLEERIPILSELNNQIEDYSVMNRLMDKLGYSEELRAQTLEQFQRANEIEREEILEDLYYDLHRIEEGVNEEEGNNVSSLNEEELNNLTEQVDSSERLGTETEERFQTAAPIEQEGIINNLHDAPLQNSEEGAIGEENETSLSLDETLEALMEQLNYSEKLKTQILERFQGSNLTEQREILEELYNTFQGMEEIGNAEIEEGIYAEINAETSLGTYQNLLEQMNYPEQIREEMIENYTKAPNTTQQVLVRDLKQELEGKQSISLSGEMQAGNSVVKDFQPIQPDPFDEENQFQFDSKIETLVSKTHSVDSSGISLDQNLSSGAVQHTQIRSNANLPESSENDQSDLEESEGILDRMDLEIEYSHTGINPNSIPALEERGELESVSPQEIDEDPVNLDINPGENLAEAGEEAIEILEGL